MTTISFDPEAVENDWMAHPGLKCRGLPAEWFYPNRPSSLVIRAKGICSGADGRPPCSFRQTCLEHAIDHKEDFGVWGGTSERDRRKIQRARNKRIKADEAHEHIYTLEEVRFPGVLMLDRRPILFVFLRRTRVLARAA